MRTNAFMCLVDLSCPGDQTSHRNIQVAQVKGCQIQMVQTLEELVKLGPAEKVVISQNLGKTSIWEQTAIWSLLPPRCQKLPMYLGFWSLAVGVFFELTNDWFVADHLQFKTVQPCARQ